MPVIKSAVKRMKQSRKRYANNLRYKNFMKQEINRLKMLLRENKTYDAKDILKKIYSVIDVCAKKNIIHKNTAARKKSRLAKMLKTVASKNIVKKGKKTEEESERKNSELGTNSNSLNSG